jgi:hypothetical protein
MNENEYENESSDDEQPQQPMAESYANVVQTNLSRNSKPPDVQGPIDDGIDNPNTVKLDDEQSQQTMAESYANVVQTNLSRNCIFPDVQDPNDFIYYKVHLWKQTLKSELKILLTANCNDTIDKAKILTILSVISK